jgi:hypothetical protein
MRHHALIKIDVVPLKLSCMSGDDLHVAIVRHALRELGARFDGYSAKLARAS